MDQPAPLPTHIAELDVVERFAALIDGLCAAIMAEMAPRTWWSALFRRVSNPLAEHVCGMLRGVAERIRALAADVRPAAAHAPEGMPLRSRSDKAEMLRRVRSGMNEQSRVERKGEAPSGDCRVAETVADGAALIRPTVGFSGLPGNSRRSFLSRQADDADFLCSEWSIYVSETVHNDRVSFLRRPATNVFAWLFRYE